MLTASINLSASGAGQVIAAPGAGKRIRVLHFFMTAAALQTVQWQSAANNLEPARTMAAGVNIAIGPFFDGVFDCNVNEALNLTLGTNLVQVSGMVGYTTISG